MKTSAFLFTVTAAALLLADGAEGFSYVSEWIPKDEWQQVAVDCSTKSAPLNVIIRDDRQLDGLLIDGITVNKINL